MQYECTLFHEKWMSFGGEVARTKLYYLRAQKLLPYTIVEGDAKACPSVKALQEMSRSYVT